MSKYLFKFHELAAALLKRHIGRFGAFTIQADIFKSLYLLW